MYIYTLIETIVYKLKLEDNIQNNTVIDHIKLFNNRFVFFTKFSNSFLILSN